MVNRQSTIRTATDGTFEGGVVVIPAAGLGTRLRPLTHKQPKCLVPVAGQPILFWMIDGLHRERVTDIVIVVGYRQSAIRNSIASQAAERWPGVRFDFVVNEQYSTTNNVYSLHLTAGHWGKQLYIIDADMIVSPPLLSRLFSHRHSGMAVDRTCGPDRIDIGVEIREGIVFDLDKELPPSRLTGAALPISCWFGEDVEHLRCAIKDTVERGNTDIWYQYVIRDIAKHTRISAIPASSSEWWEVDTVDDLRTADEAILKRPDFVLMEGYR